MQTIQVPLSEYQKMQEEIALLKNSELLKTLNRLIDLLYQEKYGLYMGDFTEDLTAATLNRAFDDNPTSWDNV